MLTRRQKWRKAMRKITYDPSYIEKKSNCLFCDCINISDDDNDDKFKIPKRKIKFLNKVMVYEYSPCIDDQLWWKEVDYINFRNNNVWSSIYNDKYHTI